jgi:DNA-binding MarR family transcriptional regulator
MPEERPANLKQLFSYRLNRLAHLSSALAARMNQEKYGMQARDWRVVAMLAAFGPMSLNTLAREVNVDKSQASRCVTDLITRGLIDRGADEKDGRGVQLSLTREGRALYRKVFPKAVSRNEELLSVLSAAEREVLDRALEVLTDHALDLLDEGKRSAPRKNADSTRMTSRETDPTD